MNNIEWIKNEISIEESLIPKGVPNSLKYIDTLLNASFFNEPIRIQSQLIYYLNKIINRTPFGSINLSDDNFVESKNIIWGNGILEHKRCPDIFKIKGEEGIINGRAYGYKVKHQYNDDIKQEIIYSDNGCDWIFPLDLAWKSTDTMKLFISKGGIVTGDYIDFCYINKKRYVLSNNNYVVRDPIKIPISIIETNNMSYNVVDHREPKLKALMEFYNCPIKHADVHFNIRSYGKL